MDRDELRETRDLLILEARLIHRYAARIGRTEVRRELRAAYHRFDDAPIRSYVMILTEIAVCRQLTGRADSPVVPSPALSAIGAST